MKKNKERLRLPYTNTLISLDKTPTGIINTIMYWFGYNKLVVINKDCCTLVGWAKFGNLSREEKKTRLAEFGFHESGQHLKDEQLFVTLKQNG